MLRPLLTLVVVAAGAVVALWQLDVIQLPFARGTNVVRETSPQLFSILESGDAAQLEAALAEGADANALDAQGRHPLVSAIRQGAPLEMVSALIEAGADVNWSAGDGWTPLMYAASESDDPKIVQWLMFAGADPTATNADGQTAADLALRNPSVASTWLLSRLDELASSQYSSNWPSGYTVPVEGATISSRSTHLPGALRAYRNGTHEGFDFYDGTVSVTIEYGTPIHAVADGVVIRADHDYQELTAQEYDEIIVTANRNLDTPEEILDKLRGRQVWIRHPGGFVSRYAHLSAISEGVREGVMVRQGDLIAATGNSGTLEAAQGTRDDPHPHVEIWRGDESYLGRGLESCEIYPLAAQVFGSAALPPYTESCPGV